MPVAMKRRIIAADCFFRRCCPSLGRGFGQQQGRPTHLKVRVGGRRNEYGLRAAAGLGVSRKAALRAAGRVARSGHCGGVLLSLPNRTPITGAMGMGRRGPFLRVVRISDYRNSFRQSGRTTLFQKLLHQAGAPDLSVVLGVVVRACRADGG